MAVTYRSSTVANTGTTTATSISVNAPAGVTADDFLYVAIAYTGGTDVTITPPAGWGSSSTSNTGTAFGIQVFRRHAISVEPSVYVFTFSSAQYASAISVAYNGLRAYATGGTFFPASGTSNLDGSGTVTGSNSFQSPAFPYYGVRWVASFNTGASLSVTDPGAGLTKRADTSTGAGSFIQLALTDGLTGAGTLNSVPFPAASLSGASTNNKSVALFLRQDQTQVTTPGIDSAGFSATNSVTSGSVSLLPSMAGEQAVVAFHVLNAAASVVSVTSPGVNWTRLAAVQNPSNTARTEVWTATLPVGGAVTTASYTLSAAAVLDITAMNLTAAGPITNFSTATSDSGSPSASLTTSGAHSQILAFISDTSTGIATVASASNVFYQYLYLAGASSARMLQHIEATAGTSTTSAMNLAASAAWTIVQLEVPPVKSAGNLLQFFN